MKPEKQQLIHDLLSGPECREVTLAVGTQILRRRRHWRAGARMVTALLLGVATWGVMKYQPQPSAAGMSALNQSSAPLPTHLLSDAELMALFPNTPVALMTLPNGKKVLVFPRPEDEKKYVAHL
jgi:hypothetical protein